MSKYIDILNEAKREATMRLFGEIGGQVDANLFAQELATLDDVADTVHLHINSPGGDVVSGLSIVSAMQSMKAFIHVHIDGIAASMAAVIAIAGDKISMQDYAKLMIHNPYPSDDSAEINDKMRKALGSLTDTLQTILSRRGCKKERIGSLMSTETWFTADEAKAEGLIDEIVTTKRKEEFKNLTTTELLTRIANEYKPVNNKDMDLAKIAAKLGLPATATEQQILDAIQAKETALAEQRNALVNHYLALGEKNGTVTDKNKERMKKLASADFELFAEMVTDMPEESEEDKGLKGTNGIKPTVQANGRLSAALGELKGKGAGNGAQANGKNWDWYQKNDIKALAAMEKENPALFKKLLDEYENSL
ncbi:MAG: ATP-dependent Clp protease proteolytic subunit [Parabacteroides gordonii]|nr:ATP-dependent Clp protease proteolytic subunit [Parabacteroides gordonii]